MPEGRRHADETAESSDQCNNRKADADARQGQSPYSCNVTDINPIYNIVQHINDLCCDGRQSELKEKPADLFCSQFI